MILGGPENIELTEGKMSFIGAMVGVADMFGTDIATIAEDLLCIERWNIEGVKVRALHIRVTNKGLFDGRGNPCINQCNFPVDPDHLPKLEGLDIPDFYVNSTTRHLC